jgi:hypothetical protein
MQYINDRSSSLSSFLPPFDLGGKDDGHNAAIWTRALLCRRRGFDALTTEHALTDWCAQNRHAFTPGHEPAPADIQRAARRACDRRPRLEVYGQPRGTEWTYNRTNPSRFLPERRPKAAELRGNGGVVAWLEHVWEDYTLNDLVLEGTHAPHCFHMSHIFSADQLVCRGFSYINAEGKKSYRFRTIRGIPPTYPLDVDDDTIPDELIVPNAMIAVQGLTQPPNPHYSPRTKNNACHPDDRRILVVEFDSEKNAAGVSAKISKDSQARRLRFLNTGDPHLLLVVDSGNKSIHGWFDVSRTEPTALHRWWQLALALSADSGGWECERPFRYPNGKRRDNGATQRVIYYAPRPRFKPLTHAAHLKFTGKLF